jgi:hypothetical protein
MLDILCSCGWNESFGIMMSVWVGFLYIVYSSFCSCRCIVRSRKFMDLCVSSSIVNVMVDWLLFVEFSYHFFYFCFILVVYYEDVIYVSEVSYYFVF